MAGYKLPDPSWTGEKRVCSSCGIIDRPTYTGEADTEGQPIFDHQVVLDLVFISKPELTQKDRRFKFQLTKIGERHAKARMMCRTCLDSDDETRKVWTDIRKAADALQEEQKEPSWWFQMVQN